MANAFTAVRAWRFGGSNNKSLLLVEGTLVIDTTATGGATAGDLPASMFGLAQIIGVATISNDDDSKGWTGSPAYAATSLMVQGGAANVYMDLPNDTYKISLSGWSA